MPGMTYKEKQARYGREKMLDQKRRSYRKHADKNKAAVYAFRAKHKEKWLKYNREYQRRRFMEDPDYWRKKAVKGLYGITYDEYLAIVKAQNNACAICEEPFKFGRQKRNPPVDHCHATQTVRGVLCDLCNVMLGSARDDVNTLRRAVDYLLKTQRAEKPGA